MKSQYKLLEQLFAPIIVSVLIVACNINSAAAFQSEIPEAFRGQDDNSPYTISYDDYTTLLRTVVLDTGRSMRQSAPRARAKVGTRVKSKRNVYTAMEGNRVNYAEFKKDKHLTVLQAIRESLEKVPAEVPLKLLSSKEQLAYWLNLYNITLIEQIAKNYPKTKLEDFLYDEDDGILSQKILNVAGVDLSLDDIQYNIVVGKFGYNPLIMYGFHQGIIGAPNIRREAFDGKNVMRQLEGNAEEFINSNRGVFEGKKGVMRVSTFYERNKNLFKDFDVDLRNHLLYYAESDYSYAIENAKRLRANIKDMSINDLTGGYRERGGSANTNSAALLSLEKAEVSTPTGTTGIAAVNIYDLAEQYESKTPVQGRYSPDLLKMLHTMKKRGETREQIVNIKSEDEEEKEEKN